MMLYLTTLVLKHAMKAVNLLILVLHFSGNAKNFLLLLFSAYYA